MPRFPGGFHDLPPNHPTEKRRVLLSAQWHRSRRPGRTGQFQTDNLLTYPEENTLTATQEGEYLQAKTESPNEVEILAIVDGKVTGTAGINAVGGCYKLQHRAEFGISIAKEFWGLGIGQALTAACIDCAHKAGYAQLELDVVADNASALALYKKFGFVEYGRNPKGFRSRNTGYQELVLMRLAL